MIKLKRHNFKFIKHMLRKLSWGTLSRENHARCESLKASSKLRGPPDHAHNIKKLVVTCPDKFINPQQRLIKRCAMMSLTQGVALGICRPPSQTLTPYSRGR